MTVVSAAAQLKFEFHRTSTPTSSYSRWTVYSKSSAHFSRLRRIWWIIPGIFQRILMSRALKSH